ncbi:hypothetical protein DFP73DRAFT_524886 [Morchella snyderi]|nr:hypothetical protein DFP73DRAFT_524886 [Morchella snyderi]
MTTFYDSMSQQISNHRMKAGTFDQTGPYLILNEHEDQYSENCPPDVYLPRPLTFNDMDQAILCEITQNPELPTSTDREGIDKLNIDQLSLTETTNRDYNVNEVIIAYSASDARAWHPLSPELITLFESWTTFSWELPLDQPGSTGALMTVKFTPWISGAHKRECISCDKPENMAPLQHSMVPKKPEGLRQHGADDGEIHINMNAPASFVDVAFQELYEAVRVSDDMPPQLPSDAILMYGIHLAVVA